ncbi:hypothetical protein MBRA1_001598 [Malassezia brasiliensis]|uniref:Uncharacterized protein n=1 Tax=Malassezia brasiliensis TaxID=1821822 RepID=A0AAF0DVW3_9BASI|nr:hypothetical protein MBRA1_001598 [Malassezia brasiliensis]
MSQSLTPFENALAGALGGVFSNAVVYPLDTVKTRIQADKAAEAKEHPAIKKQLGIIGTLFTIVKSKGGFAALYRGFMANMANAFIQQFAYFYWYTLVRSLYIRRVMRSKEVAPALSTATELVLGALSAALGQLFTTPVGVIATRQQIGTESHEEDDTMIGHIKEIYHKDGITGFWRGLRPSLVLTVNPAITYGVYERIKTVILAASDGHMTPGKSFVVGALSKTLATVVTFPYILSKIRLQAKNTPYQNAFEVLGHILEEKGLAGWYQGMQAQITKAVLSQALLFYFRDYFEIWTLKLLEITGNK